MDRTLATIESELPRGVEIFGPTNGPLDLPTEALVTGPYYINAEERATDLAPGKDSDGNRPEADGGQVSAESEGSAGILPVDRRDFMRLFSTSAMLASAACVRRPVENAIPYAHQPVDFVPGVAVNYATTCQECAAGCGLVVKTREGRPVKVEGNDQHPSNLGGVCSLGQSTLQALYHPERRKKPMIRRDGILVETEWDEFYKQLGARFAGVKNLGIIAPPSSGHVTSFYRDFLRNVGASEANLFTYDAHAHSGAVATAHKIAFGIDGMPRHEFAKADLVVGIGADFLDVGTSVVHDSKGFSQFHSIRDGKRGQFTQFESMLTQTGAKADTRHVIAPGGELGVALALVQALLEKGEGRGGASERTRIKTVVDSHAALITSAYESGLNKEAIEHLAVGLIKAKGLVVCGTSQAFQENGTLVQLAAIMANILIGSYGNTLFFDEGWIPASGESSDAVKLVGGMAKLDAVIIIGSNPIFSIPASFGLRETMGKIPLVVSLQSLISDTDELAHFVGNVHHFLETWGDEQTYAGVWSLRQPAVRPVTDSHQAEDVLLWLCATIKKPMALTDYGDYLRGKWKAVHAASGSSLPFDVFFHDAQRKGFVAKMAKRSVGSLNDLTSSFKPVAQSQGGLRLLAHLDSRLRDGRGANRPILQEAGDGLSTIAWDTWVAVSPATAEKMGFKRNDMLLVEGPGGSFKAALYPMPGLHPDTVAVPRGNGHSKMFGKTTEGIGADPLMAMPKKVDPLSGAAVTCIEGVKLSRTGEIFRLAAMQKSADVGNRADIVRDVSIESAVKHMSVRKDLDDAPDMYPKLPQGDYRWGMAIDLDKCTGCGACMVACAAENNVPQLGRKQVVIGREMHWIRMDRYFKGGLDNPQVTFQPMLCQQCNHAPCEAVCPVFATTHDPEGINAQTYNRCIGTRYCANACPYKVRRFNWFTYNWNQMGDRPVDRNLRALNPDVTVRTRGVMEKCTFCIQRITVAKHKAKEKGTKVKDGDVVVACQQTCPSDAITFGDLSDPNSRVAMARQDNRAYLALGGEPEHKEYGLKTLPNVNYMKKIVLVEGAESKHHE